MLALSNLASASCSTDTSNSWECLQVGGTDATGLGTQGPFPFSGTAIMSYGGIINYTCSLSLDAKFNVDTADNLATLTISNGSISAGDSGCSNYGLAGFPWTATASGDIHPKNSGGVNFTFPSVVITFSGTTVCSGSLTVNFENNDYGAGYTSVSDASIIKINSSVGSCSISGTLADTGTDVNMW